MSAFALRRASGIADDGETEFRRADVVPATPSSYRLDS